MGLRSRLVLVVEAHGAIGAEVISVSRLGGITAFNSVQTTAGNHLTLTLDHKVDFFRSLVVMGGIRPSRSKIHPEETGHHVCLIDRVARSRPRAKQQPVEDRGRMTRDRLFLDAIRIDNPGAWRSRANRCSWRGVVNHYQ